MSLSGLPSMAMIMMQLILSISICHAADTQIRHPDEKIRQLYSSRVTFDKNGIPEVGVGLMHGKQEFSFRSEGPIQVSVFNPDIRRFTLATTGRLTLKLRNASAGKATYSLSVASIRQSARDDVDPIVEKWKKLGFEPNIRRIGSIIALKGQVINNVRYLVTIGDFASEKAANSRRKQIREKHDVDIHMFDSLVKYPKGVIEVTDSGGSIISPSHNLVLLQAKGESPITVVNGNFPRHQNGKSRLANRSFRGQLFVTLDRDGKLALGNWTSLERLLAGTVPSEIFPSAPIEAIKAQAVAARGQLLAKLGTRHLADPYHICATVHCQMYAGSDAETQKTNKAIEQTKGQFLVIDGELVDTVYSSSCGGHTENNENVWHTVVKPNLRGRLDAPEDDRFKEGVNSSNLDAFLDSPPDAYCAKSGYNGGNFRWQRILPVDEISSMVNRKHGIGKVKEFKVLSRGVSGRLIDLEIIGDKGRVVVSRELPIRRLLGNLPSALVRIWPVRGEDGQIAAFQIDGAGFGHGVGLCQLGAIGRARQGQSYRDILLHYYGKARLLTLY